MIKRHLINLKIKPLLIAVGTLVVVAIIGLGFLGQRTTAAPVVGFNSSNIIDDFVFTNKNAMSVNDIQAFLNNKVASCDTWGVQPSEFGGGTRRQWAEARGHYPPYTCLRDYSADVSAVSNICGGNNFSGGRKSSAQIIYDAAQACSINPQVLIVLLQKEQGLVTDTWPIDTQYRSATGYGCPDTAPCDSQYYGLANQVLWSARMFRAILSQSPTWYTPYVIGQNYVRWSPNSSCGGSVINIENGSTQALYNYTPYMPNQAALNAGYGQGDGCSAYGNRNFYLYFTDWFGSVRANDTIRPHPDGTLVSFGGAAYLVENGALRHITNGFYFDINNYKWKDVKPATTGDRNLPKTTPIDYIKPGVFYRTSASSVYQTVVSGTSVSKQVISYGSFVQLKDDWSKIPVVPDSVAPTVTSPDVYTLGRHPDGSLLSDGANVYLLDIGTRRYIKPVVFYSYQWSWGDIKTATEADKALPIGVTLTLREGTIVSSAGNLYIIDEVDSTTVMRPIGPWECYSNAFKYGTPSDNVVSLPSNELLTIGARISCQ